ncbi:MAG: TipAS antibiotic-recognition domain-containing protein [Eubacteriaceae bacterium]|nr:TipAS antibiotic-recognition domain-containing protein [Eubacteriaceae bacterium]
MKLSPKSYHFYDEINLHRLQHILFIDERFTQNIDQRGQGLAAFMSAAIGVYCSN